MLFSDNVVYILETVKNLKKSIKGYYRNNKWNISIWQIAIFFGRPKILRIRIKYRAKPLSHYLTFSHFSPLILVPCSELCSWNVFSTCLSYWIIQICYTCYSSNIISVWILNQSLLYCITIVLRVYIWVNSYFYYADQQYLFFYYFHLYLYSIDWK